ncbi:MAG: hypothetical protein RMK20_10365 [Verrucomicrobiales bacterium]|nr:hypothetical protein [Verrucomicrobiales bacterium]
MNERKLNALFRAARQLPPPVPEPGFENRVLAAVRAEAARAGDESWFTALGAMLPRFAWGAATVIVFCVAADWSASAFGVPGLTDGLARLADQWLLSATGF